MKIKEIKEKRDMLSENSKREEEEKGNKNKGKGKIHL